MVPPGWVATSDEHGAVLLDRDERPMSERLDPVTLQVMLGGLRAVCEEMGAVLVRAAHSANIKERRDASTALFDAAGQMVMQAEHIPVHLGAMPDAVAAVLGEDHAAGDTWILNDPYRGGTHLPDITLVSPLFRGRRHVGFAATRAHHADVGGEVPGSMPARSRRLEQEGVVIPPTRLARDWQVDAPRSTRWSRGCAPRASATADLRAQLAANRLAARRMEELADRHGDELLERAMEEVLLYAERRTRASIAAMPDGRYRASDLLEDDGGGAAARPSHRLRGADRRRRADGRLRRHRPSERGQPQLPAVGDEVRRLLRGAGADRPRHPAVGRRIPPGARDRAGRHRRERAASRRGRRRQRRDVEPHRRRHDGRARPGRGRRPRPARER